MSLTGICPSKGGGLVDVLSEARGIHGCVSIKFCSGWIVESGTSELLEVLSAHCWKPVGQSSSNALGKGSRNCPIQSSSMARAISRGVGVNGSR